MKTPITYYGGKQKLAGLIISELPSHVIYCEPFLGGGAVFFEKPKSKLEVINDNNKKLISFYNMVLNNFDELQYMISNTLHSESMYQYAKDVYNERVESNELEIAWSVWLLTNSSFAGSIYGGWKWSNYGAGSHVGIYLDNKRNDFVKKLHERLKHVQISCRDALQVIKDRDTVDTCFYIDSPYPGYEQQHYRGYSMNDFYQLLEILQNIKGKFILSNYPSHTLKYFIIQNNWRVITIQRNVNVANLGKRDSLNSKKVKKASELLVFNYQLENKLF
jgi:DNA adenine methylase